jgi:hypothetical protein
MGMSLWAIGFLSVSEVIRVESNEVEIECEKSKAVYVHPCACVPSHPVRTFTVTGLVRCFVIDATMSTSFFGFVSKEDPHPRLHTTSMGQPQLRSYSNDKR